MSSLLKSTRNTRALPIGSLRYIRSDCPKNLTDDEVQWLINNGITTIVDLREKKEYEKIPCRLETEEGFDYYHLPVTGGGDTPKSPEAVSVTYLGMLDEQMDLIIETIMNADTNVMYFCGAGKDNLMDFLTSYVDEHPEVDLKTIMPNEDNIKKVLNALGSEYKGEKC